MECCLAIDIGASSGRHIAGYISHGKMQTEEIFRFANGVKSVNGQLIWDIEALLANVKAGIEKAREKYTVRSLSIDTWGVDYVLMDSEREILPCYAYRDSRTLPIIQKVHSLTPFSELYRHSGCQYQPFNTVYQLYCDLVAGRLDKATDFLMIPEYLMYKLCGNKCKEYTNATTTGLISCETGGFDMGLIARLGLPERLFGPLSQPGRRIGSYEGIDVVLCATHDTGSAVEGIPMTENEPYISSGTWSLLGVKTKKPIVNEAGERGNYTNEGGVGYNRCQKNIMGMWLVNELRRELSPSKPFPDIISEAEKSRYNEIINIDDPKFLAPNSMKAAFDSSVKTAFRSSADYFRCAYLSLAVGYSLAIAELESITGEKYSKLYIVGGGAKNTFLNRLTAEATDKEVIALPIEATALGNLKCQFDHVRK